MNRKLIDYLPSVIRDVREYKVIMDSQQPDVEEMWEKLDNVLADAFTATATENGIKRRERNYKITPKATDTLDERRFRIQVKENEQLPYTYRVLERQLGKLCGLDGYSLDVNNEDYLVTIKLELKAKKNVDEVRIYARKMTPCNMIIDISIMYNQHLTLRKFTNAQLKAYTHKQLRNEVIR